ncbi:MAG: baseplate J/gp47 family protein [Xenococcaceae cyanobacterium MO_188.B29]|nr:baseplate J/gp47 family protein [Xenococcaceae cyanobacterium MO_188.B29]
MASLPPKIDQRTYEEIVAQTENLAQQFTDWKPATKGTTDAGSALIRIFARMVKTVSDRLNQVPEKNFLAFLDLIGGQLKPPQPAKVPLTFYLAAGSSVDSLVPLHTQVSAPPAEGSDEEIVFETDRELVVTTAKLQAVFVREPSQDKYRDCTLEAMGQKDSAFLAFTGDRSIPHYLYLTCPEIFDLPAIENLDLIITGDTEDIQRLQEKLEWFYWNGSQWNRLTNPPTYNNDKFTFAKSPILKASEINGKTARWLQAKLTNIDSNISANLPQITNIKGSINIKQSNLIPEVCLFNNAPLDLSKDFYPFGEQPQLNDSFYIALHDTLIKPNVTITIEIKLSHKPVNIDRDSLEITWEIGNGQVWQEVTDKTDELRWEDPDKAIKFTDNIQAKLKFPTQENMPSPSIVNGETRYWIRARITKGHYGKPSQKRKYVNYNYVAIVKQIDRSKSTTTITIAGNAADFFIRGDVIYLEKQNNNTTIIDLENEYEIVITDGKLTIAEEVTEEAGKSGTKIFKKLSISETIPPTYDPPLIQSLKLSYEFTIEEKAIYIADNDFNYYEPKSIITKLKEKAATNEDKLLLESVKELTVGEFLTINSVNYQIETINSATNQVILTSAISQEYEPNTPVNYHFRPFTPTVDKDPTLYLGFDKSFDNKTVTLYVQVEPPSPDELATDITTEVSLSEKANQGQTTLKLADITGWRQGDRIQINSNENQGDLYTITNIDIDRDEVTISPPLRQEYEQGSKIIRLTTQPKLVWEYSSPLGWQILGVQDETKAFSQRGLIQFIAPVDFHQRETFGKQLYWLRVRWQDGNFRVSPRLRRILTNTTWAVQATTLTEEVLGSSNSDRHQVFVANNSPILLGQQLEVEEGQIPPDLESNRVKVIRDDLGEIESVWVLWQEVRDFYGSVASDRHYTLDRQTGEICFGDGLAGKIPPRGRNNIRLSFYRTGGGKQGNVSSETISQLKTTIPYIDRVINLEAAAGGAEQESLERLKQRVPKELRHRDRAVTVDDMEDLAYEVSTDVARVKVVTPDLLTSEFSALNSNFWLAPNNPNISLDDVLTSQPWQTMNEKEKANNKKIIDDINNNAGQVKLIILPNNSSERQPVPSLALLEQVENYIRFRCPPTMDLVVTAPKWKKVTVETTIVPISLEKVDLLKDKVKQTLETFLHPLTGGRRQQGWEFGRHPHGSDFYSIIQSIPGVDWVDSLKVFADSQVVFSSDKSASEDNNNNDLSLMADTLIYSGNHIVTVTSPRRR